VTPAPDPLVVAVRALLEALDTVTAIQCNEPECCGLCVKDALDALRAAVEREAGASQPTVTLVREEEAPSLTSIKVALRPGPFSHTAHPNEGLAVFLHIGLDGQVAEIESFYAPLEEAKPYNPSEPSGAIERGPEAVASESGPTIADARAATSATDKAGTATRGGSSIPAPAASATKEGAVAVGHDVAPPLPHRVKCVCGDWRDCGESWWLVERRDVQPPAWLTFTGCNPPSWTEDAWKAQRFGNRLDAHHEADTVAYITGFKVEAIQHGFVGGERVIAETRCSCGSTLLRELPTPPAPSAQGAGDGEVARLAGEYVAAVGDYLEDKRCSTSDAMDRAEVALRAVLARLGERGA
jgi:hypothetical protein